MARGENGKFVAAQGEAKPPRRAMTMKEKEEIFFRELACFCNVSAALRKAKLFARSREVYERRRTQEAFRRRWDEAICEGYALLELEMLERARFGENRPEPGTEVEKRLRAVTTALGLQLLKLYHARVKGAAAPAAGAAAVAPATSRAQAAAFRKELSALLSEFNRRLGGEG